MPSSDWPEIRPPVKLLNLLSEWPNDVPLVYGDESGAGVPITEALSNATFRVELENGFGIFWSKEDAFTATDCFC